MLVRLPFLSISKYSQIVKLPSYIISQHCLPILHSRSSFPLWLSWSKSLLNFPHVPRSSFWVFWWHIFFCPLLKWLGPHKAHLRRLKSQNIFLQQSKSNFSLQQVNTIPLKNSESHAILSLKLNLSSIFPILLCIVSHLSQTLEDTVKYYFSLISHSQSSQHSVIAAGLASFYSSLFVLSIPDTPALVQTSARHTQFPHIQTASRLVYLLSSTTLYHLSSNECL